MLVTKLMLSAEEEIGPDNVPCLRNIDAIWLVTSPVLWLLANSILLIIFGGKTIVEGSNLAVGPANELYQIFKIGFDLKYHLDHFNLKTF